MNYTDLQLRNILNDIVSMGKIASGCDTSLEARGVLKLVTEGKLSDKQALELILKLHNLEPEDEVFDPSDSSYFIPNSHTLQNKLGITSAEKLESVANEVSEAMSALIKTLPFLRVNWDVEFYKDLHRTLLCKVYSWSGEYRTVDIGISYDKVMYESLDTGLGKIEEVFSWLNREFFVVSDGVKKLKVVDFGTKISTLARVFGTLKCLQPFRDGNTRTALLFTSILASNWNVALDFSQATKDEDSLDAFGKAQVNFRDNDYDSLIIQFACLAEPLTDRPELRFPRVTTACGRTVLQQIEDMQKARRTGI